MKTKKSKKVTINVPITFNVTELDNILSGCFEGGSTYWLTEVTAKKDDWKGATYLSDVVSKGGSLLLFDGEENETHTLNLMKLLKGIVLYVQAGNELDFESMDGGTNDEILQYALFGKVIYG